MLESVASAFATLVKFLSITAFLCLLAFPLLALAVGLVSVSKRLASRIAALRHKRPKSAWEFGGKFGRG